MNQVEIAKSISSHNFQKAYDSFDESIVWTMVGGELLEGKDAVVAECEESAEYLATVKTTFKRMELITTENAVVIESEAEYIDEQEAISVVASCDIYTFKENVLSEITSYNIELPK